MATPKKMRGVLEFISFSTKVKFLLKDKELEFNHINDFINFEAKNNAGFVIFMTDKQFGVIYKWCRERMPGKLIKVGEKTIGFSVGENRKSKTFYLMKYKIGTDNFDFSDEEDRAAAFKLIEAASCSSKQGYTSYLRTIINVEEPFLQFHVDYKPSLSPLIFAKCNREFSNVACYDFCSFYPYLLTQELPHFTKFIKKEEMDLEDETKTYYGGLRIYNIKAKNAFYSISLIGENNETEIAAGQGINILNSGTRLISAEKVIIFGWIPFLLEELQDYDFDYIEMTDKVAEYELRIDYELREKVLESFEKKQTKKRNGVSYTAEKVLLNRYYGYFITKGNRNAPAHYGQFIVAKGKTILRRLALEIGLKDIVQGHTDSIKFVGKHEDVIERYNKTIEFEELGKLANEGIMEKVIYYNTNRAKYLMNGKLGLKHGGIAEEDLVNIFKMRYEDIDFNTEYNKTLDNTYDEEYGFYPLAKVKKFGGSLND